jgi:hypothetical protein
LICHVLPTGYCRTMKTICLLISYWVISLSSVAQTNPARDSAARKPLYKVTDTTQLAAVNVYAKKPLIENKTDGFIYHVENSLVLPTGNAADVLRKIPGLSVDQHGNLSVAGKGSVRVYIDNKPSNIYGSSVADALQQIPAAEIARVEVITHPSAKYEAEGTDAIVNITTKKNRYNGTNGSIRSGGTDWSQSLTGTLKMRRRNLSLNTDIGAYRYRREGEEQLTRQGQGTAKGNDLVQATTYNRADKTFYSAVNMIVTLDSLKMLSGGYRYRIAAGKSTDMVYNSVTMPDSIITPYSRQVNSDVTNSVHTLNLGYSAKTPNNKSELTILGTWFHHSGYTNYQLGQSRKEQTDYKENSESNTSNQELAVQADYQYNFRNKSILETGAKALYRKSGSGNVIRIYDFASDQYLSNDVRSNTFNYNRGIYAAYTSYTFNFASFNIRLGARYEQTRLTVDFKDTALQVPDYKNFVPAILVSRTFNESHTVKFSYRKTIVRPYLYTLNPNVNYSDSLNIRYGNPYLVPAITHGYQLGYSYSKGKLVTEATVFYNRNMNSIENIRLLKPNGISETTYQNIGHMQDAGVTATLSMNGHQKFSVSGSVTPRYVSLESKALQVSNRGYTISGNLTASYRITKTLGIETTVYAHSRAIGLQGTETRYQYYFVTLSKKWFDEQLVVACTAEGFITGHQTITQTTYTGSFTQVNRSRFRSRFFQLSITYKFGKKDVKVPQVKQLSAEP